MSDAVDIMGIMANVQRFRDAQVLSNRGLRFFWQRVSQRTYPISGALSNWVRQRSCECRTRVLLEHTYTPRRGRMFCKPDD
jgi:hypothetical protein